MPGVPVAVSSRRISESSASNDITPNLKALSTFNDQEATSMQSGASLEDNTARADEKAHVHQERKQDDLNTRDVSGGENAPDTTDEGEYISGIKRYSLMASLVLCFFLIMLDMAIVSTVWPQQTI